MNTRCIPIVYISYKIRRIINSLFLAYFPYFERNESWLMRSLAVCVCVCVCVCVRARVRACVRASPLTLLGNGWVNTFPHVEQ
jgi:hypothetical protein